MPPERRQLDLRRTSAALAEGDGTTPSMAAIARAVGVAKPTLYRLAGSRAELIRLCVDAEAERLLGHLHEMRAPSADGVAAAVERFAAESPGGAALLFGGRHPEARPAVRRIEDRLADLLRRADPALERPPIEAARLLGAAAGAIRRAAEDT